MNPQLCEFSSEGRPPGSALPQSFQHPLNDYQHHSLMQGEVDRAAMAGEFMSSERLRLNQQWNLRGTGHISAMEAAREHTVPQLLSLVSEAPWACLRKFIIH